MNVFAQQAELTLGGLSTHGKKSDTVKVDRWVPIPCAGRIGAQGSKRRRKPQDRAEKLRLAAPSSKSVTHREIRRQASASFSRSTTRPMRMCPAALGPKASPASTETPYSHPAAARRNAGPTTRS